MKIVRESISFERGKKPRESMGIGLDGAIYQYFKENYDDVPLDYAIIGRILEEDELEPETKKDWVTHLLKKNPDKYDFDENDLYQFEEYGIDYLDAFPNGYKRTISLDLLKKNGNFYVQFPEMSYLAELFDTHSRDISYEAVEQVLSGDAWDFFESWADDSVVKEYLELYWDKIDTAYLMDRYHYEGGEEELPEDIINDIWSDDKFEEIKQAISNAFNDAQTNAAESEAYNQMKKGVLNHYEIGEPMWNDQEKMYTAQITKDGAEKLFKSSLLGEEKYEYYEPYGGYMAGFDPEDFSENLDSKLEQI